MTEEVYLVTGAGGALATGVLPAFRARGAALALCDVVAPEDRLDRDGETAHGVDLTDPDAAQQLVADLVDHHGRLDGLVHLVGGFTWGPAHDATPGDYDRMLDLNLRTLFCAGRAVLPVLRGQGRGFLAGIASGQAWHGGAADVALYAAAKAGVAAWLRSVDAELAGTDVAVAVVFPMGVIDTPANRSAMPDADPSTWIDPREIGETLAFAASRGRRGRLRELSIFGGR